MEIANLKNGSSELLSVVKIVTMHLKELMSGMPGVITVFELHSKCVNPQHEIFSKDHFDLLISLGLIQADGLIHSSIRNIVLSSFEGEGFDLALINPIVSIQSN